MGSGSRRCVARAFAVALPVAALAAGLVGSAPHPVGAADFSGATLPADVREQRRVIDGVGTRTLGAAPRGQRGAREAAVFVHGFPGSSIDFAHLVGRAGRFGRAVAIDMPGLGAADAPRDFDYSVGGEADFLEAMLDRLGIRRPHLVLHDFGGFFGLEWAARHRRRYRSITLISLGIMPGYTGHPFAIVSATPGAGEAFNAVQTRETFGAGLDYPVNPRPLPEPFIDRMYADYDRGTRAAVPRLYRSTGLELGAMTRRHAAALGGSSRPAVVIWGDEDPYVPSRYAERQREFFPRADVHVLERTGHFPFVDEVRRTRRLVIGFLRRHLGGRSGRSGDR